MKPQSQTVPAMPATDPVSIRPALVGAALFALGTVIWASVNPLVKLLSGSVRVEQILWVRFAGHLALALLCFMPGQGWKAWRTAELRTQLVRSLLVLGLATSNFLAVSRLPVAQAVAIMFTFPFVVCLLAAPVLDEHVSRAQWLAVTTGFAGVLAIVRPGVSTISWGMLFAAGSSLFLALLQILTRKLGTRDAPGTTQLYTALAGTVALTPVAYRVWAPPTAGEWLVLCGVAVCAGTGMYCVILGQTYVPAVRVAPLAYLQVVTCVLYDVSIFGFPLDILAGLGTALIVAAGTYATAARSTRRAPGTSGQAQALRDVALRETLSHTACAGGGRA